MLDDTAYLKMIAADPDDDGPRLLYADYLDEKGDAASVARAEFIRVQCALAAGGASDPTLSPLRQRERDLLTAHWQIWLKPACRALGEPLPDGPAARSLGAPRVEPYKLYWIGDQRGRIHFIEQDTVAGQPYLRSAQFRRGFLSHAALMHKSTRSELHVARLWDVAPLDGLTLLGYEADALRNTIRAIDGGGRLRSLELRFTTIEAVSALAELGGLRELILAGVQGGDPAEVLASGTNLTGLRTLIFDSCRISDFGASELRRSVFAARLERLEMISCGLTDRVAYELIGGFSASNSLTRLDLSQNRFSGSARNELENRFAGALVINTGDRPWPMRYYL